ncbi:hypothetical protein [Thermus sediminis]|uniref:hypothetical protein n=1 Tax=Thermus sediminis TaxID=1761908 RepID=UPI000E3C2584|nr:hypothetical protein [Thermus sediminis]
MGDKVEFLVEDLEARLSPEALKGLAADLKAVFAHHLQAERILLLTGRDARGRLWLRVVAVLKGTRPPGEGGPGPG